MNKKYLMSTILGLAMLLTQVGVVLAAPANQDATGEDITGIVTGISLVTDEITGDPTAVEVTLQDETGATQTVQISLEDAAALGLLDMSSGEPVVNEDGLCMEGEEGCLPITITADQVIGEGEGEEVTHPVALALSTFFGIDAGGIMSVHEEGVGFGLIAQALWMANDLGTEGGTLAWQDILMAKQEHDFSSLLPEDYEGTPINNWGQFKKYVKSTLEEPDNGHNLGGVMSGREEPPAAAPEPVITEPSTDGALTGGAMMLSSPSQQSQPGQNNGNGQGNGKHGGNGNNGNGKGKGRH